MIARDYRPLAVSARRRRNRLGHWFAPRLRVTRIWGRHRRAVQTAARAVYGLTAATVWLGTLSLLWLIPV